MAQIYIGKALEAKRKMLKIKQKDICLGLCAPSKLCKIEAGEILAPRKLLEALAGRLGLPNDFIIPVTKAEFIRAQIERDIVSAIATSTSDFLPLLEKYKNCESKMDKLEEQFYLYALSVRNMNYNKNEEALENILKSIRLSVPDFLPETDFSQKYLSCFELGIIGNVSKMLHGFGKTKNAIEILNRIDSYFESHKFSIDDITKTYPPTLVKLANYLGMENKINESVCIAQKGIDFCKKYKKYAALSILHYINGFGLYLLGKKEDAIQEFAKEVYFSFLTQDNHEIQLCKSDIIKSFGHSVWKEVLLEAENFSKFYGKSES